MPLNYIPALDESYPLYDWADWQSSRNALVSGTPTRYFTKEAWNAIVDSLNDALTAAGLSWDSTYTTAEGAKITVTYGKLTAQKFNSVRHNIDWPAPLGWAWADREDFRGYVGRADFNGRSTHGRDCDLVYPEYIIELVRKLNLLLEIMRGTAMIGDAEAKYLISISYEADVKAGRAASVETSHISSVRQSAEAWARKGVLTTATQKSFSSMSADAVTKKAVQTSASLQIPLLQQAEGESKQSIQMESSVLMGIKVKADAEARRCVETSARQQSATILRADGDTAETLPFAAEIAVATTSEAEMLEIKSLPTGGEVLISSKSEADVSQREALPTGAEIILSTQPKATVDKVKEAPVEASCRCGVKTACELDTAWYPPIWVNGGLWIRQSHSVAKNENGELVIT